MSKLSLTRIKEIGKHSALHQVIVGLEPTGHYWKPLAHYLTSHGIKVVLINPYHTKKPWTAPQPLDTFLKK